MISVSFNFELIESLTAPPFVFEVLAELFDLADFRPLRFFGRVFFFVPKDRFIRRVKIGVLFSKLQRVHCTYH